MTLQACAWLASYDRRWLGGDVVTGVTRAAYFRFAEVRGQARDALHRPGTASEGLLTIAHQTMDDAVAEGRTTSAAAAYAGGTSAAH